MQLLLLLLRHLQVQPLPLLLLLPLRWLLPLLLLFSLFLLLRWPLE